VVAALVEARLFVSELMGLVPGFRIAHEALLRRWPRMCEWIEAHKGTLLERTRLANTAARWVREGRSADLLLPRGRQLDAARAVQDANVFDLSEDELALIRLSARRVRHRDRLRLLASGAIVGLALLASLLGISANNARRLAEQHRVEAEGLIGYMLGDFADRLRRLGRLDLLDSVSTRALAYLGTPRGGQPSMRELGQRAQALQVIAEVSRARGNAKEAQAALTSAQRILMEQHGAAPDDAEVMKNLGANAYWLGQLAKDRDELDRAAALWQQYLEFSQALVRLQPDKVDGWLEQSYAHNNLGSLAWTLGNPAAAAREFAQSIALKRRVLARRADSATQSATLMEELADSYSWLGTAREALGELDAARELFAQEMAIIQKLRAAAPHEALWVRGEARALQHRAANRLARGQDEDALADFRQARQQLAGIVQQDRLNLTWQGEVAVLELEEQAILARTHPDPAVLGKLADIQARLASLAERNPSNVVWALRAENARSRLAAVLLQRGQVAAARHQAEIAVTLLDRLLDRNQARTSLRSATIQGWLVAARISAAAGDTAAQRTACRRAHDLLGLQAASSMYYQVLDPWVRVNYCLGKDAVAEQAARRLQRVGYQDADYLNELSTHQTKGKP